MRYSTLLSSLSLVAVLGGCAIVAQDTTRSSTDPLSFVQTPQSARIEGHALALTRLGDQLVRRSTVGADQASDGLLSQNELERSIDGMNTVMANLEHGLAEQDAALAELERSRSAREISRRKYKRNVEAINESRARIAQALAMTAAQAERATLNMQSATQLGQTGLEDYVVATSQIATGAQAFRTKIAPVEPTRATKAGLTYVNPRSGVLR